METLSLEEKIYQMFILGLSGDNLSLNPNLEKALEKNLGGVIFFTQNITSKENLKNLVSHIKAKSKSPLFLSIDQEGGRVERTLNLYGGSKYFCARDLAQKGEAFAANQTKEIAQELVSFGLNMNFAPVLDVNTNPRNPVIAERSYSSKPEEVIRFGKIALKTYMENGIIPVGKHFPGHGDTSVDSHQDMPIVDLDIAELEKTHIAPFCALIKEGLPAVMAAHVHYTAFEKDMKPASVSKKILDEYLRKCLNFEGLIISDDMVMGGIKGYTPIEACMRGIEAGINMFIYRNSDNQTLALIDSLVKKAQQGLIDINKIDESAKRIQELKMKFKV